ncbi:MAG: sialidase family protein, partial [Acidimicrobiales bacterium]
MAVATAVVGALSLVTSPTAGAAQPARLSVATAAPPSTQPSKSIRVSSNVRLGSGGPSVRGADIPGLAVDPANPRHIVEVDEDFIAGTCDYHVSFDGGATWAGGTIAAPAGFESPPCHQFDIGGYAHSDASVAFGSGGNVYTTFSSQPSPTATTQSVLVARSTDGGRSFGAATVALAAGSDGLATFQRPQLAVKAHAGGDRVYVDAWGGVVAGTHFGASSSSIPGCGQPCGFKIVMATSDNGGSTWSAPEAVSAPTKPGKAGPAAPLGITREQSRPVVAPNGDLYVAWRSLAKVKPDTDELVVGRSTNGGATWAPVVVGGAGNAILGLRAPTMAVGPHGTIYVAYQLQTSKGLPDIAVVHSSDGGVAWSAPASVVDPANVGDAHLPQISVAPNGRVDVAWFDFRNSPGTTMSLMDVYMASSTDHGQAFSANRRITDRSIDYDTGLFKRLLEKYFYTPAIAAIGANTDLVAWGDSRLGNVTNADQDIFDAKVTFDPSGPVPVSTLGAPTPPSTPEQASVALAQLAYPGGQETAGSKVVVVNSNDP